jgi:hypothetical protein
MCICMHEHVMHTTSDYQPCWFHLDDWVRLQLRHARGFDLHAFARLSNWDSTCSSDYVLARVGSNATDGWPALLQLRRFITSMTLPTGRSCCSPHRFHCYFQTTEYTSKPSCHADDSARPWAPALAWLLSIKGPTTPTAPTTRLRRFTCQSADWFTSSITSYSEKMNEVILGGSQTRNDRSAATHSWPDVSTQGQHTCCCRVIGLRQATSRLRTTVGPGFCTANVVQPVTEHGTKSRGANLTKTQVKYFDIEIKPYILC